MPKPPAYWFKAKSTGFGWSMPLTWQGWIVYIVLIGAIGHAVVFGENVGQKLLGTWIPILLALPTVLPPVLPTPSPLCVSHALPLRPAARSD